MARMLLRNEEWEKIYPLLPSQEGKQGRPRKDDRLIIEGILWIIRTGAPWRDLPPEFGSWKTVYSRLYFWTRKGIWQRMWVFLKNRCKSRTTYY